MAKATTVKKSTSKKASAQLIDGDNVKNLDVEEMPAQLPPPAVLTPEQKTAQEVARFDVARAWIADRKEQYKDLKISGISDKEGEKSVKAAWQEIRNKRLMVANKHKEIKADYLTITRGIDKEKNELTELLEEVENPLKEKLDQVENEKKEIELKKEREAQEMLQGRVATLLEHGMKFNGSFYVIGDTISMDVVTLKDMDHTKFHLFLNRVERVHEEMCAVEEEKQRKEQEERDRLEAQRIEQERVKKEIEEQQQELKRQAAEIEKQKQYLLTERTKERVNKLSGLGMKYDYGDEVWYFQIEGSGRTCCGMEAVKGVENDKWVKIIDELTDLISAEKSAEIERKKKREEEAEAKRLEQEKKDRNYQVRANQLLSSGFQKNTDGDYVIIFKTDIDEVHTVPLERIKNDKPAEWDLFVIDINEMLAKGRKLENQYREAQAKKQEADRVAALSDVEKVNEYLRTIIAVINPLPEVSNKKIKSALQSFDKIFASAYEDLTLVLDNIK